MSEPTNLYWPENMKFIWVTYTLPEGQSTLDTDTAVARIVAAYHGETTGERGFYFPDNTREIEFAVPDHRLYDCMAALAKNGFTAELEVAEGEDFEDVDDSVDEFEIYGIEVTRSYPFGRTS